MYMLYCILGTHHPLSTNACDKKRGTPPYEKQLDQHRATLLLSDGNSNPKEILNPSKNKIMRNLIWAWSILCFLNYLDFST